MLDKSVPFHTIIMKRPYKNAPKQISMPEGFTVRTFKPGDEIGWAEIETLVLEFDSMQQALDCHKGYLSYIDELRKRQWFAVSPNGIIAATATAWWTPTPKGNIPVVHALGCRPEFQGQGLGRVVATKMLESFYELEQDKEVWLDTQTWSYKAIGLYLELGFIPVKKDVYNSTKNEYEQAVPILKEHMKEELFQCFIETAE
jgi:GNAT superfamily N-acetyltransferase